MLVLVLHERFDMSMTREQYRQARIAANKTMADLAHEARVSLGSVLRFEHGKPVLRSIERLLVEAYAKLGEVPQ